MEELINQRIKRIIDSSGKSINAYANGIGVSQPTLKACVDGSNNPSFETIQKIIIGNPIISTEWLLRGEGKMLKQDNQAESTISSGNTILGNGNIAGGSMTNVGNSRHYEVPKKGFLKIIHPDGSEEDIVGDVGLLEALNENKMLRLENDYLKGIVKDKDKMINLLEKSLKGK